MLSNLPLTSRRDPRQLGILMKKFLGTALALGATMVGAAAMAQSANAAVTFNLGAATDYVFRGVDQVSGFGNAEAFGGADWASSDSQFYLGTWVSSTMTSGLGAQNVEVDLYGGWKPTLGPVSLDIGAICYIYTDTSSLPGAAGNTSDASNFELKLAGSIPVGKATLGAKVFWTPDYAGTYLGDKDSNDGWYYEVNAAYTFTNKATLSGAIGHVDVPDGYIFAAPGSNGYTTGNIGVTYPVAEHLTIDGRVIQNDSDISTFTGVSSNKDTKVVGTLTVGF